MSALWLVVTYFCYARYCIYLTYDESIYKEALRKFSRMLSIKYCQMKLMQFNACKIEYDYIPDTTDTWNNLRVPSALPDVSLLAPQRRSCHNVTQLLGLAYLVKLKPIFCSIALLLTSRCSRTDSGICLINYPEPFIQLTTIRNLLSLLHTHVRSMYAGLCGGVIL